MHDSGHPTPAVLSVLGFALGAGCGGFILRLLMVPAGLIGPTTSLIVSEGSVGLYIARALLFAVIAAIAGAVVAFVHNEIAKR